MKHLGYAIELDRNSDGSWTVGAVFTLDQGVSCAEDVLEVNLRGYNLEGMLAVAQVFIAKHAEARK